jgi:hypothetical protein
MSRLQITNSVRPDWDPPRVADQLGFGRSLDFYVSSRATAAVSTTNNATARNSR